MYVRAVVHRMLRGNLEACNTWRNRGLSQGAFQSVFQFLIGGQWWPPLGTQSVFSGC